MSKRSTLDLTVFRLIKSEKSGAVLPLFAFLALSLIAVSGAAIDISRAISAREKLSYSIDASALSLAAEMSTTVMSDEEISTTLDEYLGANLGDADFADTAIANATFEVDTDAGTITLSSNAFVENYFLSWPGGGFETTTFAATAEVSYSSTDVELALVVDVTGSMGGAINSLKDASRSLLDVLIPTGTDAADSKVKISFVPYSTAVYSPEYAVKMKGGDYHSVSAGGYCLTEREDYGSYEVKFTDDPYNYIESNPPAEIFFGGGISSCNNSAKMVPLTADRDELLPQINAMTASGGTAGQTGIAWGWYTLSPNFANVWQGESAPKAYDEEENQKIAIIMTDGSFNHYYDLVQCGWYWAGRWVWGGHCPPGQSKRWVVRGEHEYYHNTSSTRGRDLCDAMKDAGIQIYTIYFGWSSSSAGAQTMKNCASEGNYYLATSTNQLVSTFANIAKKVQKVRLSR